uniref:Uncharacterized protein n=1 Tax=Geospiza parvula TaxID=87175 RepID=A0A8U8AU82_GEOPR
SCFLRGGGPVPTHPWKALKLHKKSLWNLSSWCILRSEEHGNQQHMVKTVQLLRLAKLKSQEYSGALITFCDPFWL